MLELSILAISLLFLLASKLYVPLPPHVCDRKKVRLLEVLLRIFNEWAGNLIELAFGSAIRNKWTRLLCRVMYCLQGRPPKWCRVTEEFIAGVPCRVYMPEGEARISNAAVIFLHGGGWCIGKPNYFDGCLMLLLKGFGCVVIAVDYRLAPESPFPEPIEDCEKVLLAVQRYKHSDYGIDPRKLALMGDSSGGNICTVLCQRALRRSERELIKCQILISPVVHLLDFQTPAFTEHYAKYAGTGLLNPHCLVRWYFMYLGIEATRKNVKTVLSNRHISPQIRDDEKIKGLLDCSSLPEGFAQHKRDYPIYDEDEWCSQELADRLSPLLLNPDLCPMVGQNLEGLAPAMICTFGADILRYDGALYVQRLRKFGVAVKWKHYEKAFHGILNMPMSEQRVQIVGDIASYLREIMA